MSVLTNRNKLSRVVVVLRVRKLDPLAEVVTFTEPEREDGTELAWLVLVRSEALRDEDVVQALEAPASDSELAAIENYRAADAFVDLPRFCGQNQSRNWASNWTGLR
jgi:hypothetical protein